MNTDMATNADPAAEPQYKHTNALADESSPYLLQHAHNPVDWHPWGDEAFELARKTGKPIFLSVGYSTCYWCHVMERQVFENEQIAKQMNERFVCVKVDREERPDVDAIYMMAVQATAGRGGWPMSVFLTPPGAEGEDDAGLKPFFCGTYFPPEPAHGQPSFPQVMEHVTSLWNDRRDEVIEYSNRVADAVTAALSKQPDAVPLSPSHVTDTANTLLRSYDVTHGGFGEAPKFPQPANLAFLLRIQRNNPNDELWKALRHTLASMARGGMYDQVGGGFHRYSTDEKWLVPHFEKMLYDNAQLIEVYLSAAQLASDETVQRQFERVARETAEYVRREMTDDTGTFWSAQDAEVDAREGLNYLWTEQQVREAIAEEHLADLAVTMYGLDQGANFQDPHHPDEPRRNVLFLPKPLSDVAAEHDMSIDELLERREKVNETLYRVRSKRKQPHTDDKVIVSWNGMMIAALARAGKQLDEAKYTDAARKAADYIITHMPVSDDSAALHRVMRDGQAKQDALLEDYAQLIHALIELHRAASDAEPLEQAIRLTTHVTEQFDASAVYGGGYYDTLASQTDLFVRSRETYDGAVPTGNSQMIHNLIDLHEVTGEAAYRDRAVADLKSFSGSLAKLGPAMIHMQNALLRAVERFPDAFADADAAPVGDDVVQVDVQPRNVDLSKGAVRVAVTLSIAKGHHLNAADVSDELLTPTKLSLQGAENVTLDVAYPEGKQETYAFADQPLSVYTGTVLLRATLKADGAVTGQPALVLEYQACTDQACMQKQTVTLPVKIEG